MSHPNDETAAATPWYRRDADPRSELRGYIAGQMARGAFYAACVFFGALIFVGLLRLLSRILPEDPYAALETARQIAHTIA